MTTPNTAARLADAELGYPDTLADYIGRYCPTEFPWGADRSAELIMTELIRPLLADLERARSIAVRLEQENAHHTERLTNIHTLATALEEHTAGTPRAWEIARHIRLLAENTLGAGDGPTDGGAE